MVKPSVPILFFGGSNQYRSSKLKVIAVGLNPSRNEFPHHDRFLRFSNARKVYPRIVEEAAYDKYLQALNGYFHDRPKIHWTNVSIHSSGCSKDLIAAIAAMP